MWKKGNTYHVDGHPRYRDIDGGWAWMVLFAGFTGFTIIFGITKIGGILIDEIQDYFSSSTAESAFLIGIAFALYTVVTPIAVLAGRWIRIRTLVMVGGIIGCIGISLCAFMYNLEYVVFVFGISFGTASALFAPNTYVAVAGFFDKRRPIANGIIGAGSGFGQFIFPSLLQYLIDTYTIKGALMILGAIYLNIVTCGAVYWSPPSRRSNYAINEMERTSSVLPGDKRKNKKYTAIAVISYEDHRQTSVDLRNSVLPSCPCANEEQGDIRTPMEEEISETPSEKEEVNKSKQEQIHARCHHRYCTPCSITNRVALLFATYSFLYYLGYFGFITYVPLSAKARGISDTDRTLLVALPGATDIAARIGVGFLSQANIIQNYKLLIISGIVTAVSVVSFILADRFWWMAISCAMYGLFGGTFVGLLPTVVADLVGMDSFSRGLTMAIMAIGLGTTVGPPLLGYLYDVSQSYNFLMYLSAGSMMAGCGVLSLYPVVKRLGMRASQ